MPDEFISVEITFGAGRILLVIAQDYGEYTVHKAAWVQSATVYQDITDNVEITEGMNILEGYHDGDDE